MKKLGIFKKHGKPTALSTAAEKALAEINAPKVRKRRVFQKSVYHLIAEVDAAGAKVGLLYACDGSPETWIADFNRVSYSDEAWGPLHDRLAAGASTLVPEQTIGDVNKATAKAMAVAHASAIGVPVINP